MSETPSDVETFLAYYDSFTSLGIMLNWGLYGALCAQVYLYHLAFPDDRTLNKVLVYGIYILETVQAILLVPMGFHIYQLGSNHTALFSINAIPPVTTGKERLEVYSGLALLGGIVAFVVQSFYAYRLRILSHSWLIMIIVVTLALFQLVGEIMGGIYDPLPISGSAKNTTGLVWGVLSIACDTVIAISMTYFLLRNDTNWKSTHKVLLSLVRLAVETGTVTVIIAISYLVLFYSPTLPNVTPQYILGKVYSNTMMVNLNNRIKFSGGRNDTDHTDFSMPPTLTVLGSHAAGNEIQERGGFNEATLSTAVSTAAS